MCERYGIPYVIDYEDRWANDFYLSRPRSEWPPKWLPYYLLARILEPIALKKVAHVVAVSAQMAANIIRPYRWLSESDTSAIPFGAEPADFDYVRQHPRKNPIFDPQDGLVHVSYVGRGGPDIMPGARVVFEAIKAGLQRSPELFGRMRLHLVGTTYDPNSQEAPMQAAAVEMGLGDLVSEQPARVSYLDAMQILLDSHALVLIGSIEAQYTASKVFPYILSQRPLLALFHEASSVVQIIREVNAGEVITFSEERDLATRVDAVGQSLERLLRLPSETKPDIDWDVLEAYTARGVCREFATIFDDVLGHERVVDAR